MMTRSNRSGRSVCRTCAASRTTRARKSSTSCGAAIFPIPGDVPRRGRPRGSSRSRRTICADSSRRPTAPTARSWGSPERSTGLGSAIRSAGCSATGRLSRSREWRERPGGPRRDHIRARDAANSNRLAYPAATVDSPDYYRARAAAAILGGFSSARLFTEVREKRGLCYSVYATYEGQPDRAAMLCYAGTSADRAQQTLDVMLAEIERLGRGGVAPTSWRPCGPASKAR